MRKRVLLSLALCGALAFGSTAAMAAPADIDAAPEASATPFEVSPGQEPAGEPSAIAEATPDEAPTGEASPIAEATPDAEPSGEATPIAEATPDQAPEASATPDPEASATPVPSAEATASPSAPASAADVLTISGPSKVVKGGTYTLTLRYTGDGPTPIRYRNPGMELIDAPTSLPGPGEYSFKAHIYSRHELPGPHNLYLLVFCGPEQEGQEGAEWKFDLDYDAKPSYGPDDPLPTGPITISGPNKVEPGKTYTITLQYKGNEKANLSYYSPGMTLKGEPKELTGPGEYKFEATIMEGELTSAWPYLTVSYYFGDNWEAGDQYAIWEPLGDDASAVKPSAGAGAGTTASKKPGASAKPGTKTGKDKLPKTGDASTDMFWLLTAGAACCALIVVAGRKVLVK